jgi:TRAP-type C4-dicarboxylate transport system permease small subunit
MIRPNLNVIAVTLWFFFGVLAILGFLYVEANFFAATTDTHSPGFWIETAITAGGVAAISGLVVDALRLVTSTVRT